MAPPEMAQIDRVDSFIQVPLYYGNTDYDSDDDDDDDDDCDDYERWLMEDHPLRSYPTECCPGLLRWWSSESSGVKAGRLFRLLCVVVMMLYAIYAPYSPSQ